MKFDLDKYKRLFLTEAKEHLESITKILEKARNNLSESEINTLFREAHSLKGMSAAMGYQGIADLSHAMENLMQELRSGSRIFDESIKEKLISANDLLWKYIENVELDIPLDNIASQADKLNIQEKTSGARTDIAGIKGNVIIEVTFKEDVPSLFARAFLVYKNIESFGKILFSNPDINEIKKGNLRGRLIVTVEASKPLNFLESYLLKVNEIKEFTFKSGDQTVFTEKENRPVSGGDNKLDLNLEPAVPADQVPHKEAKEIKEEDGRDLKQEDRLILPKSVKVDVNFLDYFVNITGELLTIKSSIREYTKALENIEVSNALNQMEILLKDLQEKVMRLRLTPLDIIFSRIPRWVRDLTKKLMKKIEVEIEGETLELDRSVVEALFDPMLHVIRNCVDHGIEFPAERESKGKNPKGKITVTAVKDRDHILVSITDDGRGIDPAKVLEVARKSGKFSREYIDALKTKKDILYLATFPGVSTKSEVTDISGRGVGLDVVKAALESFGGSFEIDSEPGKGTKISLYLPASISIINVLIFRIGGYVLGVPVDRIIRILQVSRDEIKEINMGSSAILYQGEFIPLTSIGKSLKIKSLLKGGNLPLIISNIKGVTTAIGVDEIMGYKEVYLRSLNPPLSHIPGFYSSTILGDGMPILIIDTQSLS